MRHRKQILLFFAAVLIPSLALIFFTQKIVRQEKELSFKRADDEQRRLAREIGRDLLFRLERLKAETSQNEAAVLSRPDEYSPPRPEIVMVGLVEEDRLFLPWEIPYATAGTVRRTTADPRAQKSPCRCRPR